MSNLVRGIGLMVAVAALASPSAYAATQLVLGSKFQVKNPGEPSKRSVSGRAKERLSNDTLVGDPTVNGATLEVIGRDRPRVGPGDPVPEPSRERVYDLSVPALPR
jgi:hypothetical protein